MPPSLKAAAMAISAASVGEAVKVSRRFSAAPELRVWFGQTGSRSSTRISMQRGEPVVLRALAVQAAPSHAVHLLTPPLPIRSWCDAAP